MSEHITNRFLSIIPNAIPWRDRRRDDSLVDALVRQGATDAEAIDVLAADRERLRAECARLLMFQPPPAIVLEGVYAQNAAVLAEREACRAAVAILAEDEHGDISDDWNGGWEAAIESSVAAIAARARK